jgi:hypothetical protein
LPEKQQNKKHDSHQAPILNTLVEQLGHVPLVAGFPFFSLIFCGFFISTFFLHLTQYACGIFSNLRFFEIPSYL